MPGRLNAETQKPKILKGFYYTILEEGFEGASIAKIAERIDMKPTLILHYFGNKEALTASGVDYVVERYTRLFVKSRLKNNDPEKRLNALLKLLWSKEYYETVHIAVALSGIAISFRKPRIKKKIQNLYLLLKNYLIEELESFQAEGIICVSDIEKTAEVLISMVEGSRHFRHFYVKSKDVAQYNQHMITAAMSILKQNQLADNWFKNTKIN